MSFPVVSMTLCSDLKGCSNGKLPANLLVNVAYPNSTKGRLHHTVNRAFLALAAAVEQKFGEELVCTSSADCYRTYDQQYNLFMDRYQTTPIPGQPTKTWNGQTWYLKEGMAGASTPGNSNHGWASAQDTGEYVNGKVQSITKASAWPWLLDHADDYGICWESQSEPWHIRYYKGDEVPQAVIDYENGNSPTPPQPGGTYMVQAVRSDVYKGCPSGDMVKQCQFRLTLKGFPTTVDGQAGSKTEANIISFQKSRGLAADGRCGPQTWTQLEA